MKKINTQHKITPHFRLLFSTFLMLAFLAFSNNALGDELKTATGEGSSTTSTAYTYVDVASATLNITTVGDVDKVLVIATYEVEATDKQAHEAYFKIYDVKNNTSSQILQRHLEKNYDKGIGSVVYIFDVGNDNGALEFKLQHASDNSSYDNDATGTIVAIALSTSTGKIDLSNDIQNTVGQVSAGDNTFADVLTTNAISLPVSGSILVVSSINNELTTGADETGEWKLQQRYGSDGDWADVGKSISRSISGNQDYGIASVGLISTNLPRGNYYYRLRCRGSAGTTLITENTTLVSVALAYDNGTEGRAFPAFSKSKDLITTSSNTFIDAVSEDGEPASLTDMLFYAQYNMSSTVSAIDAPSFDVALSDGTTVLYSSKDQRRTLSSNTDTGSGASVGLATGLSTGTTYTASLRHKTVGGVELTTSSIILSGFQTTDQPAEGYWTGTTSSVWNLEGNWADGNIPTASTNVYIPNVITNYPIISGTTLRECASLQIASGSTLNIESDAKLTDTGAVTNTVNAGLVIESTSASLTGSLIFGSGTPNATVQRYLADNSWHGVTPSTTGVTVADFHWSNAPESWLTNHTESTSAWEYMTTLTEGLNVGQGSMVWLKDGGKLDATATMEGTIRASDLSPTISYTTDMGQNLVGNPFSSPIDWESGTWTRTNMELTMWVWDNGSDNYLYQTTAGGGDMDNGIIPVGQGFFVRSNNDGVSVLTIPADARTHNTQAFYKNGVVENGYETYAVFTATKDGKKDGVWVGFGSNGSDGFDNGFDASKIFGGEESPQLYLMQEERMQSINYLYTLGQEAQVVPMSFTAGVDGVQTISANLNNLPDDDVSIEDLFDGTIQDLVNNSIYTFNATTEDDPNRFLLHFKSNAFGVDELDNTNNNIHIYAYNKNIYVQASGSAINKEGILEVFDIYGRKILQQQLDKSDITVIPVQNAYSYLLVRVKKGNCIKTEKVFIK